MKLSKRQFFSLGSIGVAAFMFGCGRELRLRPRFAFTLRMPNGKSGLPAAYRVLRQEDTETPFTSPLNKEKRKGTFVCAGCASGCFRPAPNMTAAPAGPASGNLSAGGIGTTDRLQVGLPRTEVHCAAAAAIWAMCSMTGPSRPASAIA